MLKRTTSWTLLLVIAFFTVGVGVRLFSLWQHWPSLWLCSILSLLAGLAWLACMVALARGQRSMDLFLFAAFLFNFLSAITGWVTGVPKQNPLWYDAIASILLGIALWATFPTSRLRLAHRKWGKWKTLQITL